MATLPEEITLQGLWSQETKIEIKRIFSFQRNITWQSLKDSKA